MRPSLRMPVIFLAALLAGAAALWIVSMHLAAEPDAALKARPISLSVDLSHPGEYSADFEQTYAGSHGQALALEIEPMPPEDWTPQHGLEGLAGQVRIIDAAGATIREEDISAGRIWQGVGDRGHIALARFSPFPRGRYQFQLDVISPASAMPPGRQVLTSRYLLCGLEDLPSILYRFGAMAALGLAGVPALILLGRTGRRATTNTQQGHCPAECPCISCWHSGNGISLMRSERRDRAWPRGRRAFTVLELCVMLVIIVLLIALLAPNFAHARRQARQAVCGSQLRVIGAGLHSYSAATGGFFPPFAFSDFTGNLPASEHWGGQSQAGDPGCVGRGVGKDAMKDMNLLRLVREQMVSPGAMICPCAALDGNADSYFPFSRAFSTYSLRVPYSVDLFTAAPSLANFSGLGLMGIYLATPGGTRLTMDVTGPDAGVNSLVVPLVRWDRTYREAVDGVDYVVSPAQSAVAADQFWWQSQSSPAPAAKGLAGYAQKASWCHQEQFNVLHGDGAVATLADDGTIRANTCPPDAALSDDGLNFSTYAGRVWRFFDRR